LGEEAARPALFTSQVSEVKSEEVSLLISDTRKGKNPVYLVKELVVTRKAAIDQSRCRLIVFYSFLRDCQDLRGKKNEDKEGEMCL
jgi:hypothetical protein